MKEVWIPVVGYEEFYVVSSHGRIKSLWFNKERILKGNKQPLGYTAMWVCNKIKNKHVLVHRLICEAFHGSCPDGMQCAHLDGNPKNNRPNNLKWVTPKENQSHRKLHDTAMIGEKNPRAKLKNNEVISIRKEYRRGLSQRELASKHGVAQMLISLIINYKIWKHI